MYAVAKYFISDKLVISSLLSHETTLLLAFSSSESNLIAFSFYLSGEIVLQMRANSEGWKSSRFLFK